MSNKAWLAGKLLDLLPECDNDEQALLLPSLRQIKDELMSEALAAAGCPLKSRYELGSKHLWRAKQEFMTGKGPEMDACCQGQTKAGYQCRNRPIMGVTRCHVHASEAERAEAIKKETRWAKRYQDILENSGQRRLVEELNAVIDGHTIKGGAA